MAAQVLMKKGKRGAAAYVQAECASSSNHQHLTDLLNLLLNPFKAIGEWETIDWCKWLMAGGRTPDEFSATVHRYDNATTCGLVWTANFVAYRCRTCGISPCMSLCAECFQKGNHEGHDFNMFRSQAGGACDCGDTSVMKESGFCHRHGPQAQVNKPSIPSDLLCVANAMMPRIILRLMQHLRDNSKSESLDAHLKAIQDSDPFLTMLHEFSTMGAAMRKVMTNVLINPQVYKNLMEWNNEDSEFSAYMRESKNTYEQAVKSLPNPEPPDDYRDCPALQEHLVHRTFLEELVFWTAKFEFPQKLVCLLLNMLPDPDYKEAFTKAFVLHYSRISMMLVRSSDPDTLSNRVVHVSVQLFSNEELALRMTEHLYLLHVMVISLKYMMSKIIIQNTLHDQDKNYHYVVDCGRHVMKDHCYWPLVSDLNNVLSHRPVAMKFLSDDSLLEMWFAFLSMFQGMNVNQRELAQHVEFEPNTYYAAFSAELEASSSPMWALVSHLKDSTTVKLTKQVLKNCLNSLLEWFEAINFSDPEMADSFQVSFHLPLHRYFAVFMSQAVKKQQLSCADVLPPPNILHLMVMHPLQVQAAFYEILCGMWVRNGLQIKGQAMTYIQCHFCNSMVDADIYLLQVCATQLPSKVFLTSVLDRFHVMEWMSLAPYATNTFLDAEHEMPMLESCLTFLATLISIRTNIGLSESDLARLEMVTLLCMGDKTHSQLMELMPEKCGTSSQGRDFEAVLAEVADYRAPNFEAGGNMLQGMYVPKPQVWEKLYDPIYVLLRAVHRRDFQTSMDRYTQYMRQNNSFKGTDAPWPPFCPPSPCNPAYEDPQKLLCSRFFHAVTLVILYKAVHTMCVSEHVMSLAIYLLDMCIAHTHARERGGAMEKVCEASGAAASTERHDLQFNDWFENDWLSANLRTTIDKIRVRPLLTPETSDEEMDVETAEGEVAEVSESSGADGGSGMMLEGGLQHPALTGYPQPLALPPAGSHQGGMLVPVSPNPTAQTLSLVDPQPSPPQFPPDHNPNLAILAGNNMNGMLPILAAPLPLLPLPPPPPAIPLPSPPHAIPLPPPPHHPPVDNTGALVPHHMGPVAITAPLLLGAGGSSNGQVAAVAALGGSDGVAVGGMGGDMAATASPPALTAGNELAVQRRRSRGTFKKRKQDMPLDRHHDASVQTSRGQTKAPVEVEVQESIISLLLKLHSKLTGMQDSYIPVTEREGASSRDEEDVGRVGDGPFFIARVLDRISRLDSSCQRCVLETRERLWPKRLEEREEEKKAREAKEREERRRKAQERQQKVMAEFAARQKRWMEQAMEAEASEGVGEESQKSPVSSPLPSAESCLLKKEEYFCAICNQTTPSTEEKPMGLVVLLQATSVLSHKHKSTAHLVLPTNDEERNRLRPQDSLASEFDRRVQELTQHFDNFSWLLSVNIGWEGGVHVQTCGHHLHLDCLKSYLQSLRGPQSQQRQQNLAVDRGEYSCPVCRQLANSVLPVSPDMGHVAAIVRERSGGMASIAQELGELLKGEPPSLTHHAFQKNNPLLEAMGRSMEEMTGITYPKYRQIITSPSAESLFLFVSSIARTNLEMELVQRGGGLASCCDRGSQQATASSASSSSSSSSTSKRSCIVPLIHVLATHSKILTARSYAQLWSHIVGCGQDPMASSIIMTYEKEVPLLLRDMNALLIQLVLILPLYIDPAYFACLVKAFYNVVYFQAVAQTTCKMTEEGRTSWKKKGRGENSLRTLPATLSIVIESLESCQLYLEDGDYGDADYASVHDWSQDELETEIQQLCLPFLRMAALLQNHLYSDPLPDEDTTDQNEFVALIYSLGLVAPTGEATEFNAALAANWIEPHDAATIVHTWCEEYAVFVNRSQIAARKLIDQHVKWQQPRLLELPESYNRVFQYYHRKQCPQCNSVPKEPSVCLLCGTMVCLRDNCCKQQNVYEAVQHSIDCGAGTAMFLAVNSSTIIVIRGKRACLWGSVYLDSFGEEDRELKRGKPLYLSRERYHLLEQQWLGHRFDHTNKKWIWHRDAL